jgi:hypothetical protein
MKKSTIGKAAPSRTVMSPAVLSPGEPGTLVLVGGALVASRLGDVVMATTMCLDLTWYQCVFIQV